MTCDTAWVIRGILGLPEIVTGLQNPAEICSKSEQLQVVSNCSDSYQIKGLQTMGMASIIEVTLVFGNSLKNTQTKGHWCQLSEPNQAPARFANMLPRARVYCPFIYQFQMDFWMCGVISRRLVIPIVWRPFISNILGQKTPTWDGQLRQWFHEDFDVLSSIWLG